MIRAAAYLSALMVTNSFAGICSENKSKVSVHIFKDPKGSSRAAFSGRQFVVVCAATAKGKKLVSASLASTGAGRSGVQDREFPDGNVSLETESGTYSNPIVCPNSALKMAKIFEPELKIKNCVNLTWLGVSWKNGRGKSSAWMPVMIHDGYPATGRPETRGSVVTASAGKIIEAVNAAIKLEKPTNKKVSVPDVLDVVIYGATDVPELDQEDLQTISRLR